MPNDRSPSRGLNHEESIAMRAEQLKHLLKDEMAPLRRFALMLTRSYEDAEDLAQDTMARSILKAHLFDGAYLRGWLFTICRRLFLNNLRKAQSRGAHCSIDNVSEAAVGVESDQEQRLEFRQTMALVRQLPRQDQAILGFIVFDGARYDETARSLGVPIGTVRSRLHRARERLRALTEGGGMPPRSVAAREYRTQLSG